MAGEIEYTKNAGRAIAFRVTGDGPIDIVLVHALMATMNLMRRGAREDLGRLASIGRLIMFDRRGSGVSDPIPPDGLPSLDDWSTDIGAVMDAVGSKRATLVGLLGGGQLAVAFAAHHPDRVTSLVLMHTQARMRRDHDYPWAMTEQQHEEQLAMIESGWTQTDDFVNRFGQGTDPDSYRRFMQQVGSPSTIAAMSRHVARVDIRPLLPHVTAPTLVLHRRDNRFTSVEVGRYIATQIPGARLVELPGDQQNPMIGMGEVVDEIEEFVTGVRRGPEAERVLAAVLFTDIVQSTGTKAASGDTKWRAMLAHHHEIVRRQIQRHGGREVNTAGDGFLATFNAAVRAIRCAQAIIADLEPTGLHIRAGIHAGEVELIGDDITGLTVDIGARVAALADADEVFVSSTVRDMSIGSAVSFDDRGTHALKGVPGEWRLYNAL